MKIAASASQSQRKVEALDSSNAANPEIITNGSSVEVSTVRQEELSAGERVTQAAGEVTEVATVEPEASPCSQEPAASAGINIAATGWLRATDKLRSYQADLHFRAEEAMKRSRDIESDIGWDGLPRMRGKRLSTGSGRRSQSPQLGEKPDTEALRRFNELWDSLAPSKTPNQAESLAVPAAMVVMPVSFGLVKLLEVVEAAMPSLT
jgi:hypothetical protein